MEESCASRGGDRLRLVVDTADQVSDLVVVAELFGWQVLSVTTRQDLGVVEVVLERQDAEGAWG